MAIKIRKCLNQKCANLIDVFQRLNKKYCSKKCKQQYHNHNNSVKNGSWEKVFENYNENITEDLNFLPNWLKQNYYPPRKIKNKK